MFGGRYFGKRYYGQRYFGSGGNAVPAPAPEPTPVPSGGGAIGIPFTREREPAPEAQTYSYAGSIDDLRLEISAVAWFSNPDDDLLFMLVVTSLLMGTS